MEEEELSVVDEILQNYTISVLKDTKSIKEIKILNNDRSSTRDAIENALYAAKIPLELLQETLDHLVEQNLILIKRR